MNVVSNMSMMMPPPPPSNKNSFMIQAGIASSALTVNILCFLILITDWKLLKKSAFPFGLNVANLFLSSAFTISSTYRLILASMGLSQVKASASYCLSTMIPELNYLGFCTPAMVLLVSGIERLIAVVCPTWYFARWKVEKNWYVLLAAFCPVLIFVLAASLWGALKNVSPQITLECPWTFVAGTFFTPFFYIVSIFGGFSCACATLVSFCYGVYRFRQLPKLATQSETRKRAQRQLQLTKAMLSIACLDFSLVVFPNVCLLLSISFNIMLPFNPITYSLYMYNANSGLNMLAHVAFNSEFRKGAIRFFRLQKFKWFQSNQVGTAPVAVISQPPILVDAHGGESTNPVKHLVTVE